MAAQGSGAATLDSVEDLTRWVRLRLRAAMWRQWKTPRRRRAALIELGVRLMSIGIFSIACVPGYATIFPDDEVVNLCRPNEDEWPMLMVTLRGSSIPLRKVEANETFWFGGHANQLSKQTIIYPRIDDIHSVTKLSNSEQGGISIAEPDPTGVGEIKLPSPGSAVRTFGEVARMRRSALDFLGGLQSISLAQLSAILAVTAQPLFADFGGTRFVQLYLYAHRVDGLQPGVYRYWQERAELEKIRGGDQRVAAAGLSLGQDLAGNACVAFSMIGDVERAVRAHGNRGYRYVHFEAGAIGHRLYLAAEALGLGATGIGAFYDDQVNCYFNLSPAQGQVVYHFAIGYPVPDPRPRREISMQKETQR